MHDPTNITNWRRIDDHITRSGQPTEEQLTALQNLGVKTVINLGLHTHEKALPDERASVAALGMTYIHIPVAFDAPTEDDFAKFCTAMAERGGEKVHVHCIVNMRVSAFFYRYQRDVLKRSEAESRTAMDSLWRPGGVWAAFIGDDENATQLHGAAPKPLDPFPI